MTQGIEFLIALALFVVLLVTNCGSYEMGKERGLCEGRGGVYILKGVEISGETVFCIEPPTSVGEMRPK